MHADSVTKSTLWRLRHERRLWLAPPFIFNNVNTAHTFPSKPGVTGVEVFIFQIQQRLRSHICTQRHKKKKKKQDKSKQTLTMRSVPCYSGTQKSSSREAAPPCFTHTYTHTVVILRPQPLSHAWVRTLFSAGCRYRTQWIHPTVLAVYWFNICGNSGAICACLICLQTTII